MSSAAPDGGRRDGRQRSRAANLVHGYRTIEVLEESARVRRIIWAGTAMLGLLRKPRSRIVAATNPHASTKATHD